MLSAILIPQSSPSMATSAQSETSPSPLIRGMGLWSAVSLNMIDMIGVGPFITMPLIVSAMGGPQAMLVWVLGAGFAMCDGLVWAELGAALPASGGSYLFLKEIYGPKGLGRLISFLFIWQLSFSAPMSIASGCLGLAGYAAFFWPGLEHTYWSRTASVQLPLLGSLQIAWLITAGTGVAIGLCGLVVFLLYRRITAIGRLSKVLWVVVMGTIAWIIFAGLTHFHAASAFDFPPGAFRLSHEFFHGLSSAMLFATYDYWGYYNVCFLGDEVRDPGRNIPRALLLSILIVAGLYIMMNVSILGVVPWREMVAASRANSGLYVVSVFMERIYGPWAAKLATGLVMWAAFGSVFSLMLGYSRVPYAAALDGNYFRVFAQVHPQDRFPWVSLVCLGAVAAAFCFLRLADVIAALVVIRIMLQFFVQAIGVIVLRVRRPDLPRPFRMWLYPVPALLAAAGFGYILWFRPNAGREIRYAIVLLLCGLAIYMARAWRNSEWPFQVGVG
ncbi:MAG TPA: APC family permease [Terriglobales bacterium]|nr:APC family permease [Terriglobales bacterium]